MSFGETWFYDKIEGFFDLMMLLIDKLFIGFTKRIFFYLNVKIDKSFDDFFYNDMLMKTSIELVAKSLSMENPEGESRQDSLRNVVLIG